MGKAGIGEPEVVEAMIERFAGDAHAQCVHRGEVRQRQLPGRGGLTEDDRLLGAV